MYVLFLFGPPASGKHSIGRILSERLKIPLFHNHLVVDVVSCLFPFGSRAFRSLREEIWLGALREAVQEDVSLVFTFAPERTVSDEFISSFQAAVDGGGGKILFVELICSEAVVEERLENESRAQFGKLRDLALYRTLRGNGAFEYPSLPEPIVSVDSGDLCAESAASAIVDAIAKAGIDFAIS